MARLALVLLGWVARDGVEKEDVRVNEPHDRARRPRLSRPARNWPISAWTSCCSASSLLNVLLPPGQPLKVGDDQRADQGVTLRRGYPSITVDVIRDRDRDDLHSFTVSVP